MKYNFFLLLISLLISMFLSPALSTHRIYDKNGKAIGYWKEKGDRIEVYDKDWSRKGYIKKRDGRLEIYDKDWKRKGDKWKRK